MLLWATVTLSPPALGACVLPQRQADKPGDELRRHGEMNFPRGRGVGGQGWRGWRTEEKARKSFSEQVVF